MDRRAFTRAMGVGITGFTMGRATGRAQEAGELSRVALESVPRISFADPECGGGVFFPSALAAYGDNIHRWRELRWI